MNRDPALKKVMVKVALNKRETNIVKRILRAIDDPLISLERFEELVKTGTRNDFRALLNELRESQFVN